MFLPGTPLLVRGLCLHTPRTPALPLRGSPLWVGPRGEFSLLRAASSDLPQILVLTLFITVPLAALS